MATPGVGVLIDPDRIDKIDPYFVEIRGTRYYGTSPEDAVREARAAAQAKKGTGADKPKDSKKSTTTNIISVAKPTSLVADQMRKDQKLLGISATATVAEIKSAFKKAVLATHTNKGGTGDVGELTAARDRLVTAAEKAPAPATAKAIKNIPTAKGGGKRRKPLKRTRVVRRRKSTTRKHLK